MSRSYSHRVEVKDAPEKSLFLNRTREPDDLAIASYNASINELVGLVKAVGVVGLVCKGDQRRAMKVVYAENLQSRSELTRA